MRQSASNFDPNLDTNPGSPFDNKVIKPLARRLGTDPFTVDLSTFLVERLKQAYPKLATDEGDNLTDLLIKPITLLWDPLVRENTRVRRGLSFSDPSSLTLEEADSLGGNFFVPRRRGRSARGSARILFAKPQDVSISQNNFVTSLGGLVYFPTALQSIRSNQMLLNVTPENLYYFDINVIAENPGTAYNIDPNELNAIANLNAAVRVTNISRFRKGDDEEDAVTYVGRLEQSLGEKSMVTLRGISAKVLESFPEVNRLNVVGYNDPEMQRDIIQGGGLGPSLASGVLGATLDDTEGQALTRRFSTTEAGFDLLVGSETGFVVTLFNATGGVDAAVDVPVRSVVDDTTLDLEDQVLIQGLTGLSWMLRKVELTLSGIPGGILFPNTPNGELKIEDGEVHIGGAYDVHTRSSDFDEATLSIANVTDDEPLLSGIELTVPTSLDELVLTDVGLLNVDYQVGDATYTALSDAGFEGYSIQVQNGPNAGTYRILSVAQVGGLAPVVTITPLASVVTAVPARWRLFDVLNIDLLEPKETRLVAEDLTTTQGSDIVASGTGLSYDEFGVAEGDVLRVTTSLAAGDYTIIADPIAPGYDQLQVDRDIPFSTANADYTIFRKDENGLQVPLVRLRTIELLDSSSQPQGSFVPYALPVDVQSRSFQNPARGVKHEYRNASLGLVSASANQTTKLYTILGGSDVLGIEVDGSTYFILLSAGVYFVDELIEEINAKFLIASGIAGVATRINEYYFGLRPLGTGYVAVTDGSARTTLFGTTDLLTSADIRTPDVASGGWSLLDPSIDFETGLDTIQVVDGRNVGFYGGPFTEVGASLLSGEDLPSLQAGDGDYFAPDVDRQIVVGARSIGSVRVYFLEPTTFEVNSDTVFTLDQGDAGVLRYVPDPTLDHQQIPALPDGEIPADGDSPDGGFTFTSASQDFLLSNINPGDELVIENHPLKGTEVLPDPIPLLAGKTFIYSVDDGPDRTLVFVQDDPSLAVDEVTRQGMVEQINASAGIDLATLDANQLKLASDLSFVVRATGTALPIILDEVDGYTPTLLFTSADINNDSPHSGTYEIINVGTSTLDVSPSFALDANWPTPVTEQTFRVLRKGLQRISTTQMAQQPAEAGLYYADIELISEGAGDAWNINSDRQLTVAGYYSEGYYLTTDDTNLTFSPAERPKLVISRTVMEDGVDDDPRNATQITGQNLQITYDRSTTVQNVNDFALSEVERTVCASPLSRHLIPHFVRFDLEYFGGSDESVVTPDIDKYIREIFPVESLDASDLQKICSDRGANKVTNPIDLIAVVHQIDRRVWVQRSQNSLSTGRLSAFIPDVVTVTRNVTGSTS